MDQWSRTMKAKSWFLSFFLFLGWNLVFMNLNLGRLLHTSVSNQFFLYKSLRFERLWKSQYFRENIYISSDDVYIIFIKWSNFQETSLWRFCKDSSHRIFARILSLFYSLEIFQEILPLKLHILSIYICKIFMDVFVCNISVTIFVYNHSEQTFQCKSFHTIYRFFCAYSFTEQIIPLRYFVFLIKRSYRNTLLYHIV